MHRVWSGFAIGAALLAAPAKAEKTAEYTFAYTAPPAATRPPGLRQWLDQDRTRFRRSVATEAAADRVEAGKGPYPFHRHEATRTWKVVTETPLLLSLSAETYHYTGGAHGGTAIEPLVWDKARSRRLDPRAMFVSADVLQRVLGARWCAWLPRERARRLGGAVADDTMFPCPKIAELTLLLGSTDRRAIDRVGLIAGQYVAGAYAEGMYEMNVPVSPELLAAVRPEWRGAFRVGR
ncbi:DUF4163 domain-containing protein [Sphingomonas yunnanensis]|uniref:DUF4163 domain-containing protein n=1 Tax=Sphingomonas yunnanensis TaxID=310400 RepID=UPI001CA7A000|nr:DUF4163 domain-containing protein [Sphingomonas yunnanensis]MBY9064489.1 DUF4163 domain-containing protein [Sphingomonas yunnanensis]